MKNKVIKFLENGGWVKKGEYKLEQIKHNLYKITGNTEEIVGHSYLEETSDRNIINHEEKPIIAIGISREIVTKCISRFNIERTHDHKEHEDEIYVTEFDGLFIAMD